MCLSLSWRNRLCVIRAYSDTMMRHCCGIYCCLQDIGAHDKLDSSCAVKLGSVFCLVFFAKCSSHLRNSKSICAQMRGASGQRVCAKLTESFWVRVTIDDVTDKQCHLSLTQPGDSNSMSRATVLHVFCILQCFRSSFMVFIDVLSFSFGLARKLLSDPFLSFSVFLFFFERCRWEILTS